MSARVKAHFDRFTFAFAALGLFGPGLLLSGCGHETDSPALTAGPASAGAGQKGPADPDIVCVDQKSTITLTGDGFTPMPSMTLQSKTELILPGVVLTRTEDVTGAPSSASGVTVPDSPASPATSQVHWTSEQQMGFDLTPGLITPGLYDITVTNPDGTHSARFPGAFAGVPKPTLTKLSPDILCDQEDDQTVTLTGTTFLSIGGKLPVAHVGGKDIAITAVDGCVAVAGNHSAGAVKECTSATFTITKGTFPPGPIDVTLTNPKTADCTTSEKLTIMVVPPPSVTKVVPDLLCDADGNETVTLQGSGFLQIGTTLPVVAVGSQMIHATMVSGCTPVAGNFAEGAVNTCTSLTLPVAKGLFPPGTDTIVVTNPPPANCKSLETAVITILPPPAVTSVVQDLLCDAQGPVSMTITGTGFLQIGTALPTVTTGSKTYTPTVANCTPVPGQHNETPVTSCTTLKFTVAMGDLPPGNDQVVVKNPAPADCTSTDPVYFYVAPPPSISTMASVQICDAQGMPTVTVNSASTTGDFLTVTTGGTTTYPTVTINTTPPQVYTATGASGCTPVALTKGTFTEGTVNECTSLSFNVPTSALPAASYNVTVTNPAPAACTGTGDNELVVVPPPTVSSVTPASVCIGGGKVTINGAGFIPTPGVTFTDVTTVNPSNDFSGTGTQVVSSTQLTTSVPSGVGNVGDSYDVTVTDNPPNGCHDAVPHQQIKVIAGPILYFVDPNVVYNGINTATTLYVTAIQGGASAVTVALTPQGGGTTLTFGSGAGAIGPVNSVPGYPNRVQIVIPKTSAPGAYDVSFTDALGCPSILTGGLTITNTTTITLKNVVPPFGTPTTQTPITIFRDTTAAAPNNTAFKATPRAFLNPHNAGPTNTAIQLTSVSFTDGATLTGIVPAGQAVGPYDLIVINPGPGNEVGILADAFTIVTNPPPTITSVAPSSIINTTGQGLVVTGTDFRAGALVSFSACADAMGAPLAVSVSVATGAVTCNSGVCTANATVDGTPLAPGDSCVVRVANADGTYADYSAVGVTGTSLNLQQPRPGSKMTTGRRALVSAAANATSAAKFVYAIGGDDAVHTTAPFSSVEAAPVDFFGNEGAWALQSYSLQTARSFAGVTQIGRYVYVCGGTDGTNYLATCERAMVLDPNEAPNLSVQDIVVSTQTGLAAGYWFYRVSALYADTDPDNPGGQSLPSDEVIIQVPSLGKLKVQIELSWTAPADSLGAPLPNVLSYNVYRTPVVNGISGQEVLLANVDATTFTDDGTDVPGTATPLPLGSTGRWAGQPVGIPSMSVARGGLGMTWGQDPSNPSVYYAYAFFGVKGTVAAPAGNATYDYLPITLEANGHQTVAGAWSTGASTTASPRWQIGGYHVDASVDSQITSNANFIYIGGGIAPTGGSVGTVEAGTVNAGGDLGTLVVGSGGGVVRNFSAQINGYGAATGANQLFTFGGKGGGPTTASTSATLKSTQPGLNAGAWNANPLNLLDPLIYMGSAQQSGFLFLVGGETSVGPPATATTDTEIVVL